MKYPIYHWYGSEKEIPGAYPDGEPESPKHRQPYSIDIPEDQFHAKMLELTQSFDVMLRATDDGMMICVDTRGGRFRQR